MNRRSDSSTMRGWPASVRSCDDGRTSATQGESRIWLPAALTRNRPYQRTLSNRSTDAGGTARLTEDKQNALGIVSATYPVGTNARLTLWGDTNRNILAESSGLPPPPYGGDGCSHGNRKNNAHQLLSGVGSNVASAALARSRRVLRNE